MDPGRMAPLKTVFLYKHLQTSGFQGQFVSFQWGNRHDREQLLHSIPYRAHHC